MILRDLAKEIHNLATQKGWYDDRDHSEVCREGMQALIISEISEALEDVRTGNMTLKFKHTNDQGIPFVSDMCVDSWKPIGLPSEIADVVIRNLDYSEFFGISVLEPARFYYKHGVEPKYLAAALQRMNRSVCDDDVNSLIQQCYNFAYSVGFDLDNAIRIKHAYNATRPDRHGGKTL